MAALGLNNSITVNVIVPDECFTDSVKQGPIQLKFTPKNTIKEFTFYSLLNKISQFFDVDACRIGVKYLDEDADMILVSTNEEWLTAIENAHTQDEELNIMVYEPSTFSSIRFGDWSCMKCTYVNRNFSSQCEMCLTGRFSPEISLICNAQRACAVSNSLIKLKDDDENSTETPNKTILGQDNGHNKECLPDPPRINPPTQTANQITVENNEPSQLLVDTTAMSLKDIDEKSKENVFDSTAKDDFMKQSSVSTISSGSAQFTPVHRRIHCSNCELEIIQIRYKCGNCANFDLCSLCETNSVKFHNPTHVFIKILVPLPERVSHQILLPTNLYTGEWVLDCEEDVTETLSQSNSLHNPKHLRNSRYNETNDLSFHKSFSSLDKSSVVDMYYNNEHIDYPDKPSSFEDSLSQFSSGVFDSNQPAYSFKVMKEMNFSHGTKVKINQNIKKSWIIENNGRLSWSHDKIKLRAEPLLPDCIKVEPMSCVPGCKPHRQIVLTVECQIISAPPQGSSLTCQWLMSHTDEPSKTFGETLLLLVNVEKEMCTSIIPPTLLEKSRLLNEKENQVDSCEEELKQLTLWNEGDTDTDQSRHSAEEHEKDQDTNIKSNDSLRDDSQINLEDISSEENESFCVLSRETEHDDTENDLDDTFQNLSRAAVQLQLHTDNIQTDQLTQSQGSETNLLVNEVKDETMIVKDENTSDNSSKRLPSSNSETDHSDFVIVESCSMTTTNMTNDYYSVNADNIGDVIVSDNNTEHDEPKAQSNYPRTEDFKSSTTAELENSTNLNTEKSTSQHSSTLDNMPTADNEVTTNMSPPQEDQSKGASASDETGDCRRQHPQFPFIKASGAPFFWQKFNSHQQQTWQPAQPTWQPAQSTWQPAQSTWQPQQAPRHAYQYESNSNMRQLIDMGFCDRKLNQELLNRYKDNVQDVVDELIRSQNYV